MASYTVRSGQNLSQIAAAAGINVVDLVAANPQITDPDLIHPGQKINIPSGKQSAAARNTAAQRIASGSFSAGSFSATGVPGEGLMEVGQFFGGPGGGLGARAQGKSFAQIFAEIGTLPGRGAPVVGGVDQPVSVDDVAPRLRELTSDPEGTERARAATITPDPVTQELIKAGVSLEDILPKSIFQALQHQLGIARSPRKGLIPGSGMQEGPDGELEPSVPRPRAIVDQAPEQPSAPTPDIEVLLAARGRGTNRAGETIGGISISRFSPNMTNAERETLAQEMIDNGMGTGEAWRLAFSVAKPPFELGTLIDFDPIRRSNVAGQIYNALGGEADPTASGSIRAQKLMDQIERRYLPLSITDDQIETALSLIERGMNPNAAISMVARSYGHGVRPNDNPQDIANHVNTDPVAMTTEEAAHRAKYPITPGERRFTPITGNARPDTLKGQQDNWDTNVAITASYLMQGTFRGDEIASQVEDGLVFLKALADGEVWAQSVLENAIKNQPLSRFQIEQLRDMIILAQTDPDALLEFDDIREGGHDAAIEWLEENGWGHEAGDIWINRDIVGGSGIAGLLGSGFSPFGTSYQDPDYPGSAGGGGGRGSGGQGASRGVALYQWRISAPGVS